MKSKESIPTGLDPEYCRSATPYFKKRMQDPDFVAGYDEEALRIQIALAIHQARKERKFSQTVLARKAQTNQKVISRIEHGEVSIGVDLLQRIATALGLKVTFSFVHNP